MALTFIGTGRESDARRCFSAINFGAFMQRRFSRINEKGKRGRNMDGLYHFKHVAIVALVTFLFATNPKA